MWDRIEKIASRKRSTSDVVAIAFYRSSLYIGRNSHKTSPRFKREFKDKLASYSRHAEMDLLNRLPKQTDFSSLRVYVMRWRKDGNLSMARPCYACMRLLVEAGVRPERISYTNWAGDWRTM